MKDRKDDYFRFRISGFEKKWLKKAAQKQGISVSELIRRGSRLYVERLGESSTLLPAGPEM